MNMNSETSSPACLLLGVRVWLAQICNFRSHIRAPSRGLRSRCCCRRRCTSLQLTVSRNGSNCSISSTLVLFRATHVFTEPQLALAAPVTDRLGLARWQARLLSLGFICLSMF